MPKIAFGVSAYRRDAGDLPEVRVVNMFAEEAPTAEGGVILMSRKGLVEDAAIGTGPIMGMFQEAATFGGDRFVISGGSLYRGATLVGAVQCDGPVSWASSGLEIVFTGGTRAYSYDGTDLQEIDLPDDFDCLAVDFLSERFLFCRSDSQKFYWSDLLDGRTVDSLAFASAESAADGLRDLKVIRGNLYLIGAGSIEPWRTTGDSDLPYQSIQQTVQSRGALATGCSVGADNTLHFIGDDGIFYRLEETPKRISDSGIEERIIASSQVRVFSYSYEGHPFVLIVTDDDTFAFDPSTGGQFNNPRSYGLERFRASCAINSGTAVYLGDETTNQVWSFDGWTDDGGALERSFTAFFPIDSGNLAVDNLWLEVNTGRTDLLAGEGADPQIEMRYSRDAGATWSEFEAAPLGQQGEYRVIPEWRALGTFDAPGAVFEFRVTDPVGLRVSGVHVNDAITGRAR